MPYPFRVDVEGRYFGQQIINTHMYVYNGEVGAWGLPGAPAFASLIDNLLHNLAAAFIIHWEPIYTAISVDACVYSQVRVSYLTPYSPDRASITLPVNWHSGRDLEGLPTTMAAIVKRRTRGGTRRFNGRVYFSGLAVDDVAGGVILPGSDTWVAMQGAASRMLVVIENGGYSYEYAVVDFRTPADPTRPYPYRVVQLTAPVPALGAQRRRAPGHGRLG